MLPSKSVLFNGISLADTSFPSVLNADAILESDEAIDKLLYADAYTDGEIAVNKYYRRQLLLVTDF